ncbi:MAG: Head fiber protein [bacterium]|nr:Head fiber protein [bacterium]
MSNIKNYTEQGGEKTVIGGTLEVVSGGKISFAGSELKPTGAQANSIASTIAGLLADFNALLAKLREAGLMRSE